MDVSTHISIPTEGSYFEGHFPGQPILPGVAQLALIQHALDDATGTDVSICGITFTRLRQMVLPGDTLELTTRKNEEGRLRFDLKRDNKLVANGEFLLGPLMLADELMRPSLKGSKPINAIPPMDVLLPHRPPMLFLQSILAETAKSITCVASIPSLCALVRAGSTPAVVGIEAAAQAAAAWEALQRQRAEGDAAARVGYLVTLRDIMFFVDCIPADTPVHVTVELEAVSPPLSHYRIQAFLDDKLLLSGTIATFLSQDGLE